MRSFYQVQHPPPVVTTLLATLLSSSASALPGQSGRGGEERGERRGGRGEEGEERGERRGGRVEGGEERGEGCRVSDLPSLVSTVSIAAVSFSEGAW